MLLTCSDCETWERRVWYTVSHCGYYFSRWMIQTQSCSENLFLEEIWVSLMINSGLESQQKCISFNIPSTIFCQYEIRSVSFWGIKVTFWTGTCIKLSVHEYAITFSCLLFHHYQIWKFCNLSVKKSKHCSVFYIL